MSGGGEKSGVERIEERFSLLRSRGEGAFIPYICAGDPDLEFTRELVLRLEEAGADIIELGLPYSDPLADGPTIQRAAARSLEGGFTPEGFFASVSRLQQETDLPLVAMTYFNVIYRSGVNPFLEQAAAAGLDGLIVPDISAVGGNELRVGLEELGLAAIHLAAPNSTDRRLEEIAREGRGFIYCVSTLGVTGEREEVSRRARGLVKRLRTLTNRPLAVGFGISSPEHVREVMHFADGFIVGSALVKRIEDGFKRSPGERGGVLDSVAGLARSLKRASRGLNPGQ